MSHYILLIKLQTILLYTVLCIILGGCNSEQAGDSALIRFNVSATYPEKDIRLEELADIEYLQLVLDEDYLFRRRPHLITSKKIILSNNGDILIFSKDGKPLNKFNRLGMGPQDYPSLSQIIFDETSGEFFVRTPNKFVVYSESGEFKRTLPIPGGTYRNQYEIFDSESLLLYDEHNVYPSAFSLISKENGNLIETFKMPKSNKINLYIQQISERNVNIITAPAYRIVKHNAGYLLTDFSLDTVYLLSHDKTLSPILERKPKIQSMDPVVYLNSFLEAGNYQFVSVVTVKEENDKLPVAYLIRDKKTGSIYRQNITFSDFRGKQLFLSPETIANTYSSKLGLIVLGLEELRAANSENKISGKLKELVENSDEEGNDIYMLLHFK